MIDTRRNLLTNAWAQLLLVFVVVVLGNLWSSGTFLRMDLTEDRLYSLDLASRALMYKLEKPLVVKVYFTRGLQAPYNNHEQVLVDKLEDLRAYSKGLMKIEVTDPTNIAEREAEAHGFGIDPIQYRYQSDNVTEMKKVFMGVALVYGDRQEVLPAVTALGSLEYDLARAVKALITKEERKTIGWSAGHGEPDLMGGTGPLETIRSQWQQDYGVTNVPLGGSGLIPETIDALFVVGPQRPMDERSLYQLDQFLMRGGALAIFMANTRPDLRTLRPQNIYHNLDGLVGHFGVRLSRDVVVDRAHNGMMRFPVRQGKSVVQMPVNYPLIPKASKFDPDSPVVKGLDSMLFPFVSSLSLADPMPSDVKSVVLAASSETSGSIKGIATIDPTAYKLVAPGEQRGSYPLIISLTGTWPSYFASKDIPKPAEPDPTAPPDDPAARLRESAPSRLIVSGSADFVANNIPFMLNLADWMMQDDSLIAIRSKSAQLPPLQPISDSTARWVKLGNLLGGSGLLLVFGLGRWLIRRPARRAAERSADPTPRPPADLTGSAS